MPEMWFVAVVSLQIVVFVLSLHNMFVLFHNVVSLHSVVIIATTLKKKQFLGVVL